MPFRVTPTLLALSLCGAFGAPAVLAQSEAGEGAVDDAGAASPAADPRFRMDPIFPHVAPQPRPRDGSTESLGAYGLGVNPEPLVSVAPEGSDLEWGSGGNYDLSGLLRRVWTVHPRVRSAESQIDGAKYDIAAARTGWYPYIQLSSSVAETKNEGSSTLYLVQPLWNGGQTRAEIEQAEAQYQGASLGVTLARLELSDELLGAYFDTLEATEQVKLWDNYVTRLRGLSDTIRRRADRGVAPEADVQTSITRLRQAEAGRENSNALRFTGRSRLSSLVVSRPPEVRWPDPRSILEPENLETITSNLSDHPVVQASDASVRAQEAVADQSESSLWPTVSLQHRRQLDGVEFDPTNDATLLVFQYQSSAGLRGYRGSQAERARAAAVRQQGEVARSQLGAQLRSDTAQLLALASQMRAQEDATRAAVELVDSYYRQFEVGRKTWLELLNALREAHDQELRTLALRRAFWQINSRLVVQGMQWQRLQLAGYLPDYYPRSSGAYGADEYEIMKTGASDAAHTPPVVPVEATPTESVDE